MSLTKLMANVDSLKYEDNDNISQEHKKAYIAGINDALTQIYIDLPRPEILAFAEAMEAEMRRHDAEKGDSWKEMDYLELQDLAVEAIDEWEYMPEDHVDFYGLVDIANYCMMLWHRSK